MVSGSSEVVIPGFGTYEVNSQLAGFTDVPYGGSSGLVIDGTKTAPVVVPAGKTARLDGGKSTSSEGGKPSSSSAKNASSGIRAEVRWGIVVSVLGFSRWALW